MEDHLHNLPLAPPIAIGPVVVAQDVHHGRVLLEAEARRCPDGLPDQVACLSQLHQSRVLGGRSAQGFLQPGDN
eukprot:1088274-Lingulodinium_polyedra.AAC.1